MKRGLLLTLSLLGACPTVEPGDPFVPDTDADWTPGGPVARCAADAGTVEPLDGEAHVSGAGSFDPAGAVPLTYAWSLVSAPPRGEVPLDGAETSDLSFTPNVAGTWLTQLIVENADGVASEPCTAAVDVVPAQGLWVELSWNNTNDDLDLHLLKSGADFGSPDDCYHGTCTPIGTSPQLSWGASGPGDDPMLFADSVDKGPEIATIDDPAGGTYELAVHDALNDDPGSTDARLRVFVDGSEVLTLQRTLQGEPQTDDALVWFAEVQFPSGIVTTCPQSGC